MMNSEPNLSRPSDDVVAFMAEIRRDFSSYVDLHIDAMTFQDYLYLLICLRSEFHALVYVWSKRRKKDD